MRSSEDFFYQRLGKKSSKRYQKDGTKPQDVQFSNKIFHNHFPPRSEWEFKTIYIYPCSL